MPAARAACAWRRRRDVGDRAARGKAEYVALRKILSSELNVRATRKSGHAMVIKVMRRIVPEGALSGEVTAEERAAVPEEFYAVEFANPTRGAVVARGREAGEGEGKGEGGSVGVKSTYTCDEREVREFLSSPATRFHRAAHAYAVAGDAFDVGDFHVKICRVETAVGAYVGTILDVSYRATSDASTARRVLEEYAAHASAAANARAESEDELGDFIFRDLRSSCPPSVYDEPAGDLQCAISYVDALRELRR